jgi:tetratricopeptide (TPR) repeat protein
LNLGNALWMLGRYRECEAAYLTAVEIHPRYAEAWLNLAALYEQNGAVDRAAAARVRARAAASEAEGR